MRGSGDKGLTPEESEQLSSPTSTSPLIVALSTDAASSGQSPCEERSDVRVRDCPPPTDRGAEKPLRFGRRVDWFEFSVRGKQPDEIERVVGGYVAGGFLELGRGAYGYSHQLAGPAAARILFGDERPEVHVILPGKWCDAAGESGMRGLLLWVSASEGKATRIDLAIDDFGRGVLPKNVRSSIMRGQLVTHSKDAHFTETLRGESGHTVYIGSRRSRVMLRIYDKLLQSRGEVSSVRWELVLRDEAAQAVQRDLATGAWAPLFNSQLVRLVDFRDPTSSDRAARRGRMPWFESIVGNVMKAPPYMPHPVYSAEKSMQHFRRNQAPMLGALIASEGGAVDFIYEAVTAGRRRWTQKHAMVAADVGESDISSLTRDAGEQ